MILTVLHQSVSYRRLVSAVLLASLCACGSLERAQGWLGGVETAKLTEFKPKAKFSVLWQADVGRSDVNLLKPALSADAIYTAAEKGLLSRIDRKTGKVLWRVNIEKNLTGGVGFADGTVLVGTEKGEVLAYDETGKQKWTAQVSSEVLNAPLLSDGLVLVRTSDGRITALSAQDGSKAWNYERRTPALVVRNHSGIYAQRGVSFVGFAGGKLSAFQTSSGKMLWDATVSTPRGNTELERISDITSTPVVDDEMACAISFQGRVGCFQVAEGTALWYRDIESDKGMSLLRSYLYITDSDGVVYALDKETGSSIWKNDSLKKRNTTAPYVTDKYVFVADFEGYVHALDRDDGGMAARIQLSAGEILLPIQESEHQLIVLSRSGTLTALSIQ